MEQTQTEVQNEQLMKEVNEAHAISQRIAIRQKALERTFIEQGEDLILMCEEREISPTEKATRFSLLGYPTFESFAASSEINVGVRSAKLYKSVTLKYVHELGCDPDVLVEIGVSKLGLLWYHVNSENVDEWLAQAATLSRPDLLKAIDDSAHGFTGYDAARERPFVQPLHVDLSAPPVIVQNQVIVYLVNEILKMRPDAAKDQNFKTAVDVMQKFSR